MWLKHMLWRQHLQVGNWVSKWLFVCLASSLMVTSFTQSRCCPLCLACSPSTMQSWLSGYRFRIKKSAFPQTPCVTWNKSFVSLGRQIIWGNFQISGYGWVSQTTWTGHQYPLTLFVAPLQSRNLGIAATRSPWCALAKWLTLFASTARKTGFLTYEKPHS